MDGLQGILRQDTRYRDMLHKCLPPNCVKHVLSLNVQCRREENSFIKRSIVKQTFKSKRRQETFIGLKHSKKVGNNMGYLMRISLFLHFLKVRKPKPNLMAGVWTGKPDITASNGKPLSHHNNAAIWAKNYYVLRG